MTDEVDDLKQTTGNKTFQVDGTSEVKQQPQSFEKKKNEPDSFLSKTKKGFDAEAESLFETHAEMILAETGKPPVKTAEAMEGARRIVQYARAAHPDPDLMIREALEWALTHGSFWPNRVSQLDWFAKDWEKLILAWHGWLDAEERRQQIDFNCRGVGCADCETPWLPEELDDDQLCRYCAAKYEDEDAA